MKLSTDIEWAGYDYEGNDRPGHLHPHSAGTFFRSDGTSGFYCSAQTWNGVCLDPADAPEHYLVCVVPIFYHGHGYETVNTETGYRMRYVREYQAVCICGDRRPSGDWDIAVRLHEFHVDEEGSW